MTRKKSSITFFIDVGLVLLVVFTRILSAGRFLHKWDSVQFALALTDYDITRHQPHPPGYPGYIGLAWLMKNITQDDNSALVLVGIISAAVLAVAMYRFGRHLLGPRGGFIAGLFTALNPVLWYFSSIALAYMAGITLATLAVWAAMVMHGKTRWLAPVLAGLASVIWLPAGILVAPVCIWGYIRKCNPDEPDEDDTEADSQEPADTGSLRSLDWSRLVKFIPLFIAPIIIGYLPVIINTGGFQAYFSEIQSESGKHVLRFSEWLNNPLSEFLATTGSLAEFFKVGLGKGLWLLLILLIPITGEIGCRPRRVLALLPLAVAGFVSLHWGANPIVRTAGIILFFISLVHLLPTPLTDKGWVLRRMFIWWLVPGLLLFVLIYVNFVGILIIFLPALILMEAWAIERAALFIGLQTIREPAQSVKDSGNDTELSHDDETEEPDVIRPAEKTDPDPRVERFMAWVLVTLMVLYAFGSFGDTNAQISWFGIIENDQFISSVTDTVNSVDIPAEDLLIVGGIAYRHWTYYLPDSRSIWVKYVLYNPVREDRPVLESMNRIQSGRLPDEINEMRIGDDGKTVLAASFDLQGAKGLIVFPEEMKFLIWEPDRAPKITGLIAPGQDEGEPICYLIEPGEETMVTFMGGVGVWWVGDFPPPVAVFQDQDVDLK